MTIASRPYEDLEIIPVDAQNTEIAVSLLHRFFQEEGFSGDRSIIAANLELIRRDDNHWAALAFKSKTICGNRHRNEHALYRVGASRRDR